MHQSATKQAQERYERHFLQSLMARWSRRGLYGGRSLLQLGCGDGEMLAHFWESGFDVTGMDNRQECLRVAKERMASRAEWHLGNYTHTPFDDNEFDYVAVLHVLEDTGQIEQEAILKEALRLATRGVLIAVHNPWSLAHWNLKNGMNIFQLWRMLRRLQLQASFTWGAALHGPKWTWANTWKWPWHWNLFSKSKPAKCGPSAQPAPMFELINQGYVYSLLGATLFVRVDLGRGHAVTPLLLRTRERVQATVQTAPAQSISAQSVGMQATATQTHPRARSEREREL